MIDAGLCSFPDCSDHVNLISAPQRAVLPLLSVHAGLCEAVVHDAEGSHTSGESVLTRAGAGLTRVPDGHL